MKLHSLLFIPALLISAASLANPVCHDANSDLDGDGWGWENGNSCVTNPVASSTTASQLLAAVPSCSSSAIDSNNDGWAWENGNSCIFRTGSVAVVQTQSGQSSAAQLLAAVPSCSASVSDHDNDGYGWENGRSCLFRSAQAASPQSTASQLLAAVPSCSGAASNNGDGWGWENGRSCLFRSAQAASPQSTASQLLAAVPSCSGAASNNGDGWGWENGNSCIFRATSAATAPAPPALSTAAQLLAAVPSCSAAVTDFDGDGWAHEYGRSCLIRGATSQPSVQSAGSASAQSSQSTQQSTGNRPVGVRFDTSTLRRIGGSGDNWCQTWAADGSVITAMDDGDWITRGYNYHSRLYKIHGDANNFSRSVVWNYPNFHTGGDGWFAYGMLSVNGVLYSLVSKTQKSAWSEGPFRGMKMLRSYDSGNSWHRVDKNNNDRYLSPGDSARELLTSQEMFFFEEHGRHGKGKTAYPFSFASFVQSGQDHRASKDGYVYIYSPEGANSNQLQLARVPEDRVGQRSAWQYFSGWSGSTPTWSSDIGARQPNMVLPERNSRGEYFGWYSWLPSVVWNPGLQKYVMVNGGTYGENLSNSSSDYYAQFMHNKTGSLGFWHSDNPYGPWTQFYYNDYWTADNSKNLTYQPKLSPKWISSDGRRMTLIWSDAMRNAQGFSHSINYLWNQMEIEILTGN